MSVKIRLSRVGRAHLPFYRIVAVDSRKKRDGEVLANLGTYDATNSKLIQFHEELFKEWLDKGAQPSDSAKKIYRQFKKEAGSASKSDLVGTPIKTAPEKVATQSASKKAQESSEPAPQEQEASAE